jgi:hypothetical protein
MVQGGVVVGCFLWVMKGTPLLTLLVMMMMAEFVVVTFPIGRRG